MKNIIFSARRTTGIEYFEKIIGEIQQEDIEKICRNQNHMYAELYDGTTYEVSSASDNSRGCKCDKVYIDKNVDQEIVSCIICPCLICSKLPQEEQVVYF